MVLAASGPKSAAGASMRSAQQSNTKSTSSSGPRGPTGPSSSQPRSSPAGNAGGGPGSVSRSSPQSGLGSANSRGGNLGGSTTSRIGSAASAQRAAAISSGNMGVRGGPPNAAAAKASAALRSSAALNAGLGRPASPPVAGALNVPRSMGVGGAALGSFMTATEPAVRNYLASPQGQADAAAGWSDLSRMAKARVMARDALNRPGVTYPNNMPAPQGVFGPRQAPRQGYLRDANALGMITTGMPSPPSGMPQRPQGTYSGYGTFNVPKTAPQVLNASMGNTTTVTKNMTTSPIVRLPDGTFASTAQYQEQPKNPNIVGTPVDNTRVVSPRHWGREEVNYLTQIGAYTPIMRDPYASAGYNRLQNPDGSGLRMMGDVPNNVNGAYLNNRDPSIDAIRVNTQQSPQKYGGTTFHELGHAGAFQLGKAQGDDEVRQRVSDMTAFPPGHPQHEAARNYLNSGFEESPRTLSSTPNVPSWKQSVYTGPPERVLGVETVPPRSNAGSFANYASTGLPPGYAETYFSQPATPASNTVPSWQQSAYAGPVPTQPVLRDDAYNFPVKPYGAKTQKAIDTVIGATPVVGAINTGLGLLGYSAGDIFTSEENKLANMTPEQRERYRAYWSEKRNQRAGTGNGGDSARQTMMSSRPSAAPSSPPSPSSTSPTSTGWEKDAMAYGYSSTQLQDAETRALIKQLWDMGFIPKTATPP